MTAIAIPIRGDSSLYRRGSSYSQSKQLQKTSFVFDQPATQPEASVLYTEQVFYYYQAISDLESLTQLPDNWDGHGAQPVDDIAQEAATRMLRRLMVHGVPRPDILPTSNGGVAFEWESKQISLSLEIESYRETRACVWSSTEDEQEGPLNYLTGVVADALKLLATVK